MKTKDVLIYVLIAVTVWFVADRVNSSRNGGVVQPIVQPAIQSFSQPSVQSAQPVQPVIQPAPSVHQPHNPVVEQVPNAPVVPVLPTTSAAEAPVDLLIDAITCKQATMYTLDASNQFQLLGFIPHATKIKIAWVHDGILKLSSGNKDGFRIPDGIDVYISQDDICVEGQTY